MKLKLVINVFAVLTLATFTGCFSTNQSSVSYGINGSAEVGSFAHNDNLRQNNDQMDTLEENGFQPSRYGDTEEDSIQCVRNLSLYMEYYRQNNYELAYEPWKKAITICPKATQNLYIHGSRILRHRFNEVDDPDKEDALVDSLMWLHDKRIKHFDREGFVLGRKGVDLYTLAPDENIQKIFDLTDRSIDLEEEESRVDVIVVNMQTGSRLARAGVKDDVKVFDIYDRAIKILEHNIEHNPEEASRYEQSKSQIESMFRPFYKCEVLIEAFQPRFDASPDSLELLEQITSMMDEADCTDEELFYYATLNLHNKRPTASSAMRMGRLETEKNNYRQAVDYYKEAIDLFDKEEDHEQLYRVYILKTEILYRELGQYVQARESALKASEIKPDEGRPYFLIGEMYAETSEDLGDCEFTKRVGYWAAVDKFIKAREVDSDPDFEDRVTEYIDTYRQYFPDLESIFFQGYEEGDTYKVEGWINETTRVRAR